MHYKGGLGQSAWLLNQHILKGSMSTTGHAGSVVAGEFQQKKENRLVERQLEKMKTLTHSFQVGTFIFNLQSNERKYNNKYK